MANALYSKGKENLLGGSIDWVNNTIRLVFFDANDDATARSTRLSSHDALDDVVSAGRVAISGDFSGKTKTNGVADANDVTLTNVSGDQFEEIIIYKHTGTESTSLLLVNIDTATGLPLTPNGGNVTVQWDDGANKIFAL